MGVPISTPQQHWMSRALQITLTRRYHLGEHYLYNVHTTFDSFPNTHSRLTQKPPAAKAKLSRIKSYYQVILRSHVRGQRHTAVSVNPLSRFNIISFLESGKCSRSLIRILPDRAIFIFCMCAKRPFGGRNGRDGVSVPLQPRRQTASRFA